MEGWAQTMAWNILENDKGLSKQGNEPMSQSV